MIRGLFIGVDRHRDSGIRDLTGAARDATALWALFVDSIPEMKADLLRNEEATQERVLSVLTEALDKAGSEDLVIVSFAGHGTHQHQLVLHDTEKSNLASTTIAMEDLASLFRRSPAKGLLCIIDCCFSGGAPARILEDSPIPRDPAPPFEALAGKGRIIIAASNIDEVAFESPTSRHGLLTKALIDSLLAAEGSTDLTATMATVMEAVRVAASQLGVVQTPVLLGYVEGGIVLPALKVGRHYKEAFSEAIGIRVSSATDELAAFGIPTPILREWASRFSGGLNALQLSAVNDYRILDGDSLLVIAPTSSGKTFVGELAAVPLSMVMLLECA